MQISIVKDNHIDHSGSLHDLFPNCIFPINGPDAEWRAENNVIFHEFSKPYNSLTQLLIQSEPYLEDGKVYAVQVADMTPEQLADRRKQDEKQLERNVQAHLDRQVQERDYDSILSACSYAYSDNATYQAEAQVCIDWRDAVWGAFFAAIRVETLPDAQALIASLPSLTWPE